MAKIEIIDITEGTRTPFLRGILTSSLLEAGLPFDEAYELATGVRQKLSNRAQVTTNEIRKLVVQELIKREDTGPLGNYTGATSPVLNLMVKDLQGELTPFSLVKHRQSLESTGITTDKAIMVSRLVFNELEETKRSEIHVNEIGRITYKLLKEQVGKETAHRYLLWTDYMRSGRPLILLIGGTTGSGKSTIATEMAHRLGIIRTQSTDMLREVMRMMIPERLLPELHASSFSAWRCLPGRPPDDKLTEDELEELIFMGYNHQAELVSVPCEAVIQRALRERVSLILEGIHVSPALLQKIKDPGDAVIVPVMLAVLKPDHLKQQLTGRGLSAPVRGSSRYLENFRHIWELQSYLLSEADSSAMDIINNDTKDQTAERVMRSISKVLAKTTHNSIDEIFPR